MPSPKKTKTTAPHTQQFAFFMGGAEVARVLLRGGGGGWAVGGWDPTTPTPHSTPPCCTTKNTPKCTKPPPPREMHKKTHDVLTEKKTRLQNHSKCTETPPFIPQKPAYMSGFEYCTNRPPLYCVPMCGLPEHAMPGHWAQSQSTRGMVWGHAWHGLSGPMHITTFNQQGMQQ